MHRRHGILRSIQCAFAGLAHVIRTQRNAKIHLLGAAVVCALAAWLRVRPIEWAILVVVIGLVLAAEAVNTALEAAVDLLSPEIHPRARAAKDSAAGAVLIAALAAVVVGLLILGPPLWRKLM